MDVQVVSVNPADELLGLDLPGGWKVTRKLGRGIGGTGGNFSVGYEVTDAGGTIAFLKALDYAQAFQTRSPARALQYMTSAFNFERDMLFACQRRGLSRIVIALSDGSIIVPHAPTYPVDYLIFEKAERDARAQLAMMQSLDLAWILRSLHHATTGHRQLHESGMAHQDMKPSNLLVFDDGSCKLTDLGRASYPNHAAPHDALSVAGDPSYAPPELLYGQVSPDWAERCMACDLYLLGSMVVFYFSAVGMTTRIVAELDPVHRPNAWNGTYAQILPYVRDAFDRSWLARLLRCRWLFVQT